jgi:hypothetical protein
MLSGTLVIHVYIHTLNTGDPVPECHPQAQRTGLAGTAAPTNPAPALVADTTNGSTQRIQQVQTLKM